MNYTITGNYKGQKCLKNYIYLLVVIHLPFLLIAYKKDAVQRKRPRGLGQRGRCPPAPSIATAPWLRKSSPTKEAKGGRAIPSSTGGCPRSAEVLDKVSHKPVRYRSTHGNTYQQLSLLSETAHFHEASGKRKLCLWFLSFFNSGGFPPPHPTPPRPAPPPES